MMDIDKLLEIESNSYESDFVPAVLKHIRPLLLELKAARKVVEAARYALEVTGKLVAPYIDGEEDNRYDELKKALEELDGEK